MLFAEDVRATAPYQPREALQELLTEHPADPALGDKGLSPKDRVNEVVSGPASITVDLTTLDPGYPVSAETGAAQVQALVVTAQEAYGTDRPVVFTSGGKPLADLYGVDTRRPIGRGSVKIGYSHAIFVPRSGAEVTSPVTLSANPPAGESRWQVVSVDSGKTVFSQDLGNSTNGGAFAYTADDLAPGAYRFTVRRTLTDEPKGTPGWGRTVDFRVVAGAPAASTPPVSDPATGAVAVAPVFLPAARGRTLVEEWRPRTTAVAAVRAVLAGSSADPRPDRTALDGAEVSDVTEEADHVTVDFAALPGGLGSDPATELDLQAVAHTLDAYYDLSRPVELTVRRRPPTSGLPGSVVAAKTAVARQTGLFTPVTDTTVDNPLTVVGRAEPANTSLTWYLIDPVSNETRFQGTTRVDATSQVYAFSLAVPTGDYLLQTEQKIGKYKTRINYAVTVR